MNLLIKIKQSATIPLTWFRKKSLKKKLLISLSALVVLVVIGGQIQNATKPPPYTLAKVERGDIEEIVSESGTITTGSNSRVYSPAVGVVSKLTVSNGQIVNKGDVLLTVTSTATDQEKSAAYANYLAAQATLKATESNANVYRSDMYAKWKTFLDLATSSTYETGDDKPKENERKAAEFQIAQDNWKAAEAKFKDQQISISQASAQVNSTSLLYQATQNSTIKAPISGTIANLTVSEGSEVTPLTAIRDIPVMSVVTYSDPEVVVLLNETDATRVKPGQNVTIDVGAIDDTSFKGEVVRVDDLGTTTQGVVSFNAYIKLESPYKALKSGMSADVDIVTNKVRNVLTVPNAVVKPYQGGRAVRVVDAKTKKITYKVVKIGIRGEKKTQIISGLSEGQEVISALSNEQLKKASLF